MARQPKRRRGKGRHDSGLNWLLWSARLTFLFVWIVSLVAVLIAGDQKKGLAVTFVLLVTACFLYQVFWSLSLDEDSDVDEVDLGAQLRELDHELVYVKSQYESLSEAKMDLADELNRRLKVLKADYAILEAEYELLFTRERPKKAVKGNDLT